MALRLELPLRHGRVSGCFGARKSLWHGRKRSFRHLYVHKPDTSAEEDRTWVTEPMRACHVTVPPSRDSTERLLHYAGGSFSTKNLSVLRLLAGRSRQSILNQVAQYPVDYTVVLQRPRKRYRTRVKEPATVCVLE